MSEKHGFLKDSAGNFSSKRLAGFITLIAGVAIAIYAIYKDPGQAGAVIWPVFGAATALFGAGVLEKK